MTPPRPLAPFLALAPALRAAGFAAAPEQTTAFIAAVGLLGPRSIHDIRRAAHAVFGPDPDRRAAFDEVFDAVFLGRAFAAPAPGAPEDLPGAYDAGGPMELPEGGEEEPGGQQATRVERLAGRSFDGGEARALDAFMRAAPAAMPRRLTRRLAPGRGRRPDPRRAFRQMVRRDGEITRLPRLMRRRKPRRVLLLIDVSGSMKAGTEGAMRLAHALVQALPETEVFTLGTRLTRVSRALRIRNRDQALSMAAGLVADWDGGTRLGEALAVFLSVPRFAAHARGAMVAMISDGLERGGPEALLTAMARLRGLAWGILWLNPLADGPAWQPETRAMRAVMPLIDRLMPGAGVADLAEGLLRFARDAR